MNRSILMLLLGTILLGSCNTAKKESTENEIELSDTDKQQEVKYELAKGYFVKNTVENDKVESLRITSQDHFESYFGTATTMGEQGVPTSIDFKRSFVLALVGQPTDKDTSFEIKELVAKGDVLELSYTIKQSQENRSFTIHPCVILVVDKTNEKDVRFIAE
ncbi:hypothetical protein HX045_16475 [Myroides odoratimimus]|uniref:Uncharacterized protein n=2 Tax=Myroides odoratimimus TaxID=76832 RepID=A0A0U3GY84_9FLAO|nr:hypothetical protein [Myroides odoratimimus]ALU27680.1 hypothetical protein AS202_16660 [Myroides odoratimimus]EHO09655.1 hypothetical protein HMPREF9712_01637 [Myroides odoratimimus CCUG 10230]MCA4794090.1 hypothetical protein [Myroides odoratimimus]MCA4821350.1 hypothetical protein [Myroides odoratimimus]MCO7722762.1 hypothetical protein [Myroides odoratimimus]